MAKSGTNMMGMGVVSPPPDAPQTTSTPTERPVCARHNVLMVASSSRDGVTHYKCPVDGCTETGKAARRQAMGWAKPVLCDREACNGTPMEVDHDLSTPMQVRMVCPNCGKSVTHPRPGLKLRLPERSAMRDDFANR